MAAAHGSKDPRAAATIADLLSVVRARASRAGFDARVAFLDHCVPSLPGVLSALAGGGPGGVGGVRNAGQSDVVLVPLLLAAAYHSKTDIPAQVAAAAARLPGLRVHQTSALGPHPLLLSALERRLAEAGATPASRAETSVVLAAAGSSDPAANATIAALAARWQAAGGWRRVMPAFASASGPTPADAVRTLRQAPGGGPVVVASYVLAPGYFADKIRIQASQAGATAVSAPLGAAPEVAEVILDRYLSAIPIAVLARNQTDSGDALGWGRTRSGRTPLQDVRSWAKTIRRSDDRRCGHAKTRIP
ncbi:MAG: sirohydrochlorin cobaltochelatase [Actinomycetia bacterium]|nr:sirohydrochlorin cobaltochelatase [Actinomycetes bacterium]